MSATNRRRLAKRIRWAARVIGLGASVLPLIFFTGEAIAEAIDKGLEGIPVELFIGNSAMAIALGGTIVSWWRERVGGSLLILVSIALGIFLTVGAQPDWSMSLARRAWLIIGLPYLVAGVLFLISSWLSRKTDSSALPPTLVL